MAENKDAYFSQLKQIGALTAVPIILLAGPAVGYFLGGWIDRQFQFYPWCTVLLSVLGFAASGREVMRLLRQILREDKENKT